MALYGPLDSYIVNSTVTNNQAEVRGGAIYMSRSEPDVFNSTFAHNKAPEGSEFHFEGVSGVTLHNTIVVCLPESSTCTDGFWGFAPFNSIVEAGTLADFGLAELADNGGPTQTMALLPGSPLIDAGDDAVCAGLLVNHLDQRGVARPQAIIVI